MASVVVSEELLVTRSGAIDGLLDAVRNATQARGFVPMDAEAVVRPGMAARVTALAPAAGATGAQVRVDLGIHAQPVATTVARALGLPVTLVIAAGTASDQDGVVKIALTARAVRIDSSGKASALALALDAATLDREDATAPAPRDERDLERAGYDHAGDVLAVAARTLGLVMHGRAADRAAIVLRRPRGSARVEEIASLIALGSSHELVPQPDGRVLVRIVLAGGKRMAFLSAEQAQELTTKLAQAD